MSFTVGHVDGGTNAGWRIIRQPRQWTHACPAPASDGRPVEVTVTLTSYSCPICRTRRPA